jgi:FAD/FMN-containing dehydrogenase
VALADGSLLRTGTWGVAGSAPFFRQHGPDLTGLFMGDAGAYGIKTRVSLRLLRRPAAFACLSFKFGTFEAMARGMAAAAREGNHTLNFGLDPALQQGQLGKTAAGAAMQAALAVFRSSRSILDGLVQLVRMAAAGRRFLQGEQYSVHYIVEGSDARAVRSAAGRLRDVLAPFGAETANTLPAVVYALPFAPLYNILGPRGERWVPLHGILPFSRVPEFHADLLGLHARHAAAMAQHEVRSGAMFMSVATNAFLYEPVFYWQDERNACIERLVPADYLAQLPRYPPNPAGRALVAQMQAEIVALFRQHGAAHLQAGKAYPVLEGRNLPYLQLLRAAKAAADPDGRLNPGALGLQRGA